MKNNKITFRVYKSNSDESFQWADYHLILDGKIQHGYYVGQTWGEYYMPAWIMRRQIDPKHKDNFNSLADAKHELVKIFNQDKENGVVWSEQANL